MSERGLKTLAVALLVLLVLWGLVSFFGGRGGRGAPEASEALTGVFQGLTPETVDEVRFEGPGGETQVVLRKDEGGWTVNGFAADSARVAGLWNALQEATVDGLVASNPDNHDRMGVSADSAWTLEVDIGAETRTLLVGDAGSRYGTAYVRYPGEDAVHLLEGQLRTEVTRRLDDWRNKRMARVDTARLSRVEVERGEAADVLERVDTLWVVDGEEPADPAKIRALLSGLASLDANGFYSSTDSLPGRGGGMTALDQSGDTLLVLEIGSGEGDRWARVSGDSIIYRLPSWSVGRLFPDGWR